MPRLYVIVGLPLPHFGTECKIVSLEQSNSVWQQCRPTCLAYRYVYQQGRQKNQAFSLGLCLEVGLCAYLILF